MVTNVIGASIYWPTLGYAAERTLEYWALGLLGALLLGLVLALMKVSRLRVFRAPAVIYTEALKNTPLLVVIFVMYFGLPSAGIVMSAFLAGALSLAVFYAAYLSEIFRAGLEGVPPGQREAAYAVGLSPRAVMWHVILPQAARLSLAATGNMVVDLLKSTALLSTIAGAELLSAAQNITSETFRPMQTYLLVGAIYFAMCFPLSRMVVKYESALKAGRHLSRRRWRLDAHLQRHPEWGPQQPVASSARTVRDE